MDCAPSSAAQAPGGGGGGAAAAGGRGAAPGGAGAAAADRPKGTDLILRELATGQELNIGNVADFAFSKDGKFLALTIDAQDKVGNGVQLRDMTTGTVSVLDSGAAVYERLNWTEKGDALAVLKGTDERRSRTSSTRSLDYRRFGCDTAKKVPTTPPPTRASPRA